MKELFRPLVLLVVFPFVTVALFDQSFSISREIPQGARICAESYADEWCQRAQLDPHFYGVVGKQVDRGKLVLGEGYITYILQKPDAIRFAESSETDPTQFASAVEYEFPLFLESELIATLYVVPNRDGDGQLVFSDFGDYRASGSRYPDNKLDSMVVDLIRSGETSSTPQFALVWFAGNVGGVYIRIAHATGGAEMIRVGDNTLLTDEREVATKLKRRILEKAK